MSMGWSASWGHQLFFDDSGYSIKHRYNSSGTWQRWYDILDGYNYTSYTVTKTGGGASGTWDISISGNATTATTATTANAVAWENVSGKPIALAAVNNVSLATGGWKTIGGTTSGVKITVARPSSSSATWNSGSYSSAILFGASDTKGMLDIGYFTPCVSFGGGSVGSSTDDNPKWWFKLKGTSE